MTMPPDPTDPLVKTLGKPQVRGDFHAAQTRLREWVALSGTRLDRDRPTRQTIWPGEQVTPPASETVIVNRDEDFVAFVIADVNRRAEAEAEFLRRDEPEAEERP